MKKTILLTPLLLVLLLTACRPEVAPEVAPEASSAPAPSILRDIVYCSPSGVDLKLDLYRPGGASGSTPVIVFIHGGNWASGSKTTGNAIDDIPVLVQSGFAVASIEYRLAPAFKLPAQIEDAKCAVRYLRARAGEYGLDTELVGAYGVRAGGHIAAMLGVTEPKNGFEGDGGYPEQSSRVSAVVIGVGIFDLAYAFSNELASLQSDIIEEPDLGFGADPFATLSPISYISGDDAAFLLYHGEQDRLTPVYQSQVFHQNLLGGQVDSTLVILQNGGTDFGPEGGATSPTRGELRTMIVDFFRKNLAP